MRLSINSDGEGPFDEYQYVVCETPNFDAPINVVFVTARRLY